MIFRCRASDECPGFVINYERESCFRVDFNTDDRRDDLIPATSRVNYFEKVCLKGKEYYRVFRNSLSDFGSLKSQQKLSIGLET